MKPSILACLLGTLALGCSSDSGGGAGSGGGSSGGDCEAIHDLCDRLSLADVNGIMSATSTSVSPEDASDTSTVNSLCDYKTGGTTDVTALQTCAKDGPAAAKIYYDGEKDGPTGNETQEDVTGIGDEAFARYDDLLGEVELVAHQDNLLVLGRSYHITDHALAKDQLGTLAAKLLTLK